VENHELGQKIFETVKAHLKQRGIAMKQGTFIDASLNFAPSSTKTKPVNRAQRYIRPQRVTSGLMG
jgi:IS5 family transposase